MTKLFEVITNEGDHMVEVGQVVREITKHDVYDRTENTDGIIADANYDWAQRIIAKHPDKNFVLVLAYNELPQLIERAHLKEV